MLTRILYVAAVVATCWAIDTTVKTDATASTSSLVSIQP